MSFPRWWQAWKRPAAAASAAVVLSGLLATAGWAQSQSAADQSKKDREDRQQQAGDDDRPDRSDSKSQRVRDEGEERVQEEREAIEQAGQQQRRQQQSGQQSAQQKGSQSQQRSDSHNDRDHGQQHQGQQGQYGQGQHNQGQHQQGQYNQSQQRQQSGQSQSAGRRDYSYDRSSQRDQSQQRDRDQHSQHGLTWSNRNDGRLVVDSIEEDSAWDRIGLADGDRVVSINGNRVRSVQDFNRYYASVQPGQRARIVVYRDGDEETLYWTPRQSQQAQHSQSQQHGQAFLGVQLDDRYDDSAVVKAVYRGSPAERAGLRAGDTIVSLNGQEVGSAHDLTDIVGDLQPGEEVHLQIARRQNVNAQVRLGSRSSDDVRQASFEERERRSYSKDQSSDDDNDDRSSRRDNQRDQRDDDSDRSKERNKDRSDDDTNPSDD